METIGRILSPAESLSEYMRLKTCRHYYLCLCRAFVNMPYRPSKKRVLNIAEKPYSNTLYAIESRIRPRASNLFPLLNEYNAGFKAWGFRV